MNILGLIEMTPFDGSGPIVCLRIQNNEHMFDLPIDEQQLTIILSNMGQEFPQEFEPEEQEEEYEEQQYTHSPVAQRAANDEGPIRLNSSHFTMGESMWDEDDEL